MNFIFISPNFPHTYWNFCDRLRKNGVNVLGIGDAPYDGLEDGLKGALTEYYKVDSLENYDQVFRAVAFFSFKYGKTDWIDAKEIYRDSIPLVLVVWVLCVIGWLVFGNVFMNIGG